jgi:transcriptional regulator with XRE-family HTH domain
VPKDTQDFDKEAYLFRLRLLRLLYEENQVQFAKRLGIPFKRWNHYEHGFLISRETAFKLFKQEGISPEWLWFGHKNGFLNKAIAARLTKLERETRAREALLDKVKLTPKDRRSLLHELSHVRISAKESAPGPNGAKRKKTP